MAVNVMRIGARPRQMAALGLTLLVSACSGFIPKDGPMGAEVRASAEVTLEDQGKLSYAVVKLSPLTLSRLQTERQPVPAFSRLATLARASNPAIGPADTVSVTIFEAGAGGLFIPAEAGTRAGNFVALPPQEPDRNGDISIPYGGVIHALGRTPRQIEQDINDKLKGRAIEPQAVVSVGERGSNTISVLGDVGAPTVIPLRAGGVKLLTALARAGGSKFPGYETIVTLQRRGRSEQAALTSIIRSPGQDIELAAGDVVYVSHQPRFYTVFGATPIPGASTIGAQNRRVSFDDENISLAEGIAKSGGLLPATADSRSVFLFRYTPRQMLAQAGVDVARFPEPMAPTIYTVDLSEAQGYFLANHFMLKPQDIIYVSEAPSVDLIKFLNVLSPLISTSSSGITLAQQVRTFNSANPVVPTTIITPPTVSR